MGTMYPHRIIFDSDKHTHHSDVDMHASRPARFAYNVLRGSGVGIVLLVLLALIVALGPVVKEEVVFAYNSYFNPKSNSEAHLADLPIIERTIAIQNEARFHGVDPYFSVVIPKIDAKANVIPNVNAASALEYHTALQKGIAHAAGTYFPGQGKNIYLFSHSTDFDFNVSRYNAVFYLLRKLEVGDTVIVYFSDDRFVYEVTETMVVSATDTKWLTQATDTETLYLQTCDPPGTTWRRLLVVAKPIV